MRRIQIFWNLVIGQGPGARTMQLDLKPFTLVGATTRAGLITGPLRDRFGLDVRLDYYEPAELAVIVQLLMVSSAVMSSGP